jgi:ribonuclease J
MNLMVYRMGDDCIVVDAGMMFPGAEHLGVEVVVPNLDFLDECGTIHGVVLTHGHEDHIGSVPFLLARHDVPVYGTPFTLGLVRARLAEHEAIPRAALRSLPAEPFGLGPFTIEPLPVAHSIPQSVLLVLHTPVGRIVHTADFKLDPTPLDGVGLDLGRIARLGEEGVLALLSDSTNADRTGFTPSEREVTPAFDSLLARARKRVFVTTFASHIHRIQQVLDLAIRHGRRVAFVGSSMGSHVELASRMGLLRIPAGSRVEAAEAMDLPPERVLVFIAGSQGEPNSALSRVAVGKHREVALEEGDLVIHSARTIPGNEKSVGRMLNHILKRGAEVVTEQDALVHVSGHPAREELKVLLRMLRPRFLIPIHGEYRQLRAHALVGRELGLGEDRVLVAESGDLVVVGRDECFKADRVPVGQVFMDAALDPVEVDVLRDRRQVAGDGLVVTVVSVDRDTGLVGGAPEIVARGFVPESGQEGILEEARRELVAALAEASPEERSDEGLLKSRIHDTLKRFLKRRTQRRPLIVPVVVQL